MVDSIAAINAYKGIAQQLGGISAPGESSFAGQFKQLVDGVGSSQDVSSTESGSLLGGMVSSAISSLLQAEDMAQKAAQGVVDPTEVAHTVNVASLAAEQMTATWGKVISTYQELLRMPI